MLAADPSREGGDTRGGEGTGRDAVLQLQFLTPAAQVSPAHLGHWTLAEQPREGESNRPDRTCALSYSLQLSLLPQLCCKVLPAQEIHSWATATSTAENLPDPQSLPWETEAQALLYMEMHTGA